MNIITITGGTKSQRDKTESMIQFCIEMLMPRMRTLDINVKIKAISENAMGNCLSDTTRIFDLEIDSTLRLRRLLETVAHEMVHVKQYARKELDHSTKWQGKTVNPTKVSYWDLPWEIEANGREIGLFVRWAQASGYRNAAWANNV